MLFNKIFPSYFVALDISNKNIKVILSDYSGNLIDYFQVPNRGLSEFDAEKAKEDLVQILNKIYLDHNLNLVKIFFNLDEYDSYILNVEHTFEETKRIQKLDLHFLEELAFERIDRDRLIDKDILGYTIDDFEDTTTPIGVEANKLAMNISFITIKENPLVSLMKQFNATPVPTSFALKHVLNKREAEQGTIILNINYLSTNVTVVKFDKVIFSKKIDIGSFHLISDIANILNVDHETVNYILPLISRDKDVLKINLGKDVLEINVPFVASIIDARMEDILESFELKDVLSQIENIVLVGEYAAMPRILPNVDRFFRKYTRLAQPDNFTLLMMQSFVLANSICQKVVFDGKNTVTSSNLFDRILIKAKLFLKKRSN